jgi:predicted glycoside hydrolase/deacetylase ChbG (UPF0249 family)
LIAQLDAFETHFGCPPDFIDGHQHVHQLPLIREQLLERIARRYPTHALWLRSTQTARHLTVDRGKRLKARIIACLGARTMRRLADAQGLPMNRHLLGVYGFSASPEEYRQLLMSWFVGAADGDLLMCHPASAIEAADPIGQQRMRETLGACRQPFSGLDRAASIDHFAPVESSLTDMRIRAER